MPNALSRCWKMRKIPLASRTWAFKQLSIAAPWTDPLVCTLRNIKYIAKHCKYICQRIFAHSAETRSPLILHHHLGATCICTFIYFGVVAKANQGHLFVHTMVGRYNRWSCAAGAEGNGKTARPTAQSHKTCWITVLHKVQQKHGHAQTISQPGQLCQTTQSLGPP